MRLHVICLAAAASLSIAACATPPAPTPHPPPGPPQATVCRPTTKEAKTALYSAEAAYNVPAHAYVTLDARHEIPPDLKPKLKAALGSAYDALKLARQAACVGDSIAVAIHSQEAQRLVAEAQRLLPTPR